MSFGWTLDKRTGHLAHPSGLYAYVSDTLTPGGGILCVGPFSSYTDRLKRDDVTSHCASAITTIEADLRASSYTIWGSYRKQDLNHPEERQGPSVDILGDRFDFIPNLSFRTSTLLSMPPETSSREHLQKEWNWATRSPEVSHKIGLNFKFVRDRFSKLKCIVSIEPSAADIEVLRLEIRSLLIRSLSSAAYCVLATVGAITSSNPGETMYIDVAEFESDSMPCKNDPTL